jgi:MFS family permease
MAFAVAGDMMLYVVLPSHTADAGVGIASLGILLSANRIVRLGANTVAGAVFTRLSPRGPYLVGMTLAVTSTLGYVVSHGFWSLLAFRVTWGVAFALLSVGGLTIIMNATAAAGRGRTVGAYQSIVQLGTLIALGASGILTDLLGYRMALAVFTGVNAVGWLIAFVAVREPGPVGARRPATPRATTTGRRVRPSGLSLGALRGIDRRLLAAGYVTFASHLAGSGIFMATIGLFVRTEWAAIDPLPHLLLGAATVTGLLQAARRVAIIALAPPAGRWSDRLGNRVVVAVTGTFLSTLGFAVLAGVPGGAAVALGFLLLSVGEGVSNPAVVAWVGDVAPERTRPVVMAGFVTAADLGAATGPLVGYALAAGHGLRWAYAVGALMLLSAVAVLALVRRAGR